MHFVSNWTYEFVCLLWISRAGHYDFMVRLWSIETKELLMVLEGECSTVQFTLQCVILFCCTTLRACD